MIFYFSVWTSNPEKYVIYLFANKNKITKVIINSLDDFLYNLIGGNDKVLDEILIICKQYNIPIVMCSMYSEKYNEKLRDFSGFDNFKRIEWPTYWFTRTFLTMNKHENKILNLNILDKNVNLDTKFDFTFINLNHLAKKHRCQLVDLLYKNNLFDFGAISWRDNIGGFDKNQKPIGMTNTEYVSKTNPSYYKFKYWKPEVLLLDHVNEKESLNAQDILPKHYNECFMQIVTESDDIIFEITEKTCVPLLFNKPFLVVGGKNFHNNLKDLGFELYDEIFDYSFDSDDSLLTRTEGVINNVLKINSIKDKTQLFKSIEEKLLYNRRIALEMALINIPDDIQQTVQELLNSNIHDSLTWFISQTKHYKNLLNE